MPTKEDTVVGSITTHRGKNYGGEDTSLKGRYKNLSVEEKDRRSRIPRAPRVPTRKYKKPDDADFIIDSDDDPA